MTDTEQITALFFELASIFDTPEAWAQYRVECARLGVDQPKVLPFRTREEQAS